MRGIRFSTLTFLTQKDRDFNYKKKWLILWTNDVFLELI